jgi:uncharacterized DUF497 family protein
MQFEYDPDKSASNLEKHGIDFEAAKAVWDDTSAFVADVAYAKERRSIVVGRVNGKFYTAVITFRGDAIRIISVRRSRDKEVSLYEAQRNNS